MGRMVRAQAIVAGVLLGALPAGATTIEIGVATKAGLGSISTVATGTGSKGARLLLYPYDNYLITAGVSDPSPIDLDSVTLSVSGKSSKPLYVYVTETGLVSNGSALNFLSQFQASVPRGWSEIETTYVTPSNVPYGEGEKLASMTGSGTKSVKTTGVKVGPAGSKFSVTELYEFVSGGLLAALDASSETLQANGVRAAPAPSIGAGIPGMLAIGAMLLGTKLLARRRRS